MAILIVVLALVVSQVHGDYLCICNYNVEKEIYPQVSSKRQYSYAS